MSTDNMEYVYHNHDLTSLPANAKEFQLNEWLQDAEVPLEDLHRFLYLNNELYSSAQQKTFRYALRYFETTAKQAPGNASVGLMLGLLHIALGDKAQGYKTLRKHASKKSADPFIIWNACNAAIDAKQPEAALAYAERLYEIKPVFGSGTQLYETHLKLALDARTKKANPQVRAKVRRAVRGIIKSLHSTVLTRQNLFLGDTRKAQGAKATRNLNRILKRYPTHARANHLAGYLEALKCNWAKAHEYDKVAARREPGKYLYVLNAASSALQLHDWRAARKYLQLAVKAWPGEQVRLASMETQEQLDDLLWEVTYAINLAKQVKNQKAKKTIQKATGLASELRKTDKANPVGYIYGGLFMLINDNYVKAFKLLKKADEMQPRTPELLMGLTVAALYTGKKKQAVEYAAKLRKLVPRDIEVFSNYVYVLLYNKEYDKALRLVRAHNRSLQKSPVRELFEMVEVEAQIADLKAKRVPLMSLAEAETTGLLTGYSQGLDILDRTW